MVYEGGPLPESQMQRLKETASAFFKENSQSLETGKIITHGKEISETESVYSEFVLGKNEPATVYEEALREFEADLEFKNKLCDAKERTVAKDRPAVKELI
jgi:hypothetical protein